VERVFSSLFWADLGPLDLVDWASEEGSEFDLEAVVIYLRALGMGGIRFSPFDASLRGFYPSELVPPSPLGTEAVDRGASICRKQEIHFALTVPVGFAGEWLRAEHPDWVAVPEGEGQKGGLVPFCPANEGYREFLLALASELVEKFRPLAIFFRATPIGSCLCDFCRKAFLEEVGFPLPEGVLSSADPKLLFSYLSFRRAQWREVASDLALRLKERHPEVFVGLSAEGPWEAGLSLFPPEAPVEAVEVKGVLPPANVGAEVLRPLRLRAEGALSGREGERLRAELVRILAAGGRPVLSEALPLFYDCSPGESLRGLIEFVKERITPLEGALQAPHLGVVVSEATPAFLGREMGYGEAKRWALESLSGLFDLLWASSIPFAVLPVERLDGEALRAFPLIVLASTVYIPGASQEALRDYLDEGGAILSFFEVGLFDEEGEKPGSAVPDLIGCTRVDTRRYKDASMSGVELPAGHFLTLNLPQRPIAPRMGAYLPISAAVRVDPLGQGIGVLRQPPVLEEGVSGGPRMGDRTGFPAIVVSEAGPGRTAYLCFDIGREHHLRRHPGYRQLFANLVHWLSPPEFEVRGPGAVRGAMWRGEGRLVVFLWQEPACEGLVARNVEVVVRWEEPIGRVRHYPRGLTVARTQSGGRLSLLIREMSDCAILICESR